MAGVKVSGKPSCASVVSLPGTMIWEVSLGHVDGAQLTYEHMLIFVGRHDDVEFFNNLVINIPIVLLLTLLLHGLFLLSVPLARAAMDCGDFAVAPVFEVAR